jgi:1-acyl-sn-glycerol-3-phosphate acyltransferase
VLVSLYSWLVFAVVVVVGFFIQLALFVICFPFDRQRRVAGRWYRIMAVVVTRLAPSLRFRVHGPLPKRRPGRTVVVSNHVSNGDPFLVSLLPWEMKWLSKASLFKVPFMGWSLWLAGDIPVVRGKPGSARAAMLRCQKIVESGMPVMIFPEGTRSRTGELLPFKDGAFRLAIAARAEVLPIAVAGTRTAMPKHSWRWGWARAYVTVGEPISTDGMREGNAEDLALLKRQAREAIEALYAEVAQRATEDTA